MKRIRLIVAFAVISICVVACSETEEHTITDKKTIIAKQEELKESKEQSLIVVQPHLKENLKDVLFGHGFQFENILWVLEASSVSTTSQSSSDTLTSQSESLSRKPSQDASASSYALDLLKKIEKIKEAMEFVQENSASDYERIICSARLAEKANIIRLLPLIMLENSTEMFKLREFPTKDLWNNRKNTELRKRKFYIYQFDWKTAKFVKSDYKEENPSSE